ncbi:protein lifeguard 1 [Hippoglossus hippoglossus]|uniref:protein lifeguard 1 n=1 Tax=Hippoglossus hippoglossus TaxID=8267 RepID=UPI00148D5765|nr:protein lifeguard 1 [Hippoglossus hippoglossus]XP_034470546.1 protein lifeguard 1 [Hippoglossus hippoglossus]XP_034470547.1 protein lifeguard 1 [Hippoglossus hippoglossus]XP_034470548.1 protein lifeguard 1 [Hippoglossus hippoglossus]XP_034470549.1 protein lifeguard 1 [Hippoglossus hippoglossus]XP_034470550.1 protein lifeguard 1 [Hippoglossus hippoglossus]
MSDASDPEKSSPPPPPPYSYHQQPPPAYSTVPVMYCPTKTETTCISQPAPVYESFQDILPEIQSDTTPPIDSSAFDDKLVRRGFVRKVFSILTLQLVFTFSVVCVFTFSSVVKDAVQDNLWVFLSSVIIFGVVAITLAFCKSFRRLYPWNVVGLVVVTLSFSYMVGTMASFYDTEVVVITMGVTLAITVAIIAFSAQTRYDFTTCYGLLLILCVELIMFGFFAIFYSNIGAIAYGCLGALVYSLFLMFDCQLMMGAMSNRLDPEEYISAALTIYLDIVLIFLFLLGRR